jgi:hypothetical protein
MASRDGVSMNALIRMLLEKDVKAWQAGELDVRWKASDAEMRLEAIEESVASLFRITWQTARVSLGLERLLAHWAAASGLRHSEDEILAEIRAVSWDEAVQLLEEEEVPSERETADDPLGEG